MGHSHICRLRWVAPIAVALAAIGGMALAAIPSAGGEITGCYKAAGGDLRASTRRPASRVARTRYR
jgi:hypothetical protein